MDTVKITYNLKQIGGAVIASLIFQKLPWIRRYYQLGEYYIVEFDRQHAGRYRELVEKHKFLNRAVKIELT